MPLVRGKIQLPDLRRRPEPEEGPLDIVFEDEWMLVLNKPAGVVVHPTYRNWTGTLLNAVLWHVRGRSGAQPGILTRLDRNTSGLVIVALGPAVHARMQKDAAAGLVGKQYLALVLGVPEPRAGRITLPLARDADDRRRVVVAPDGAACETLYQVHSVFDDGTSLVRCDLVTGRTHQIRVHLAARGWPVLGDEVYGVPHPRLARQALHASRVSLPHPSTRQRLEFEAALAEDMARVIA